MAMDKFPIQRTINMSSPNSKVLLLRDLDHYLQLIENEKRVVIVDFSATWCGPCKKLAPTLDQMSLQYEKDLLILKVDADTDTQLEEGNQMSTLFKVKSLPTLVFLKDGQFQQGDEYRIIGCDVPKLKKVLGLLGLGEQQ